MHCLMTVARAINLTGKVLLGPAEEISLGPVRAEAVALWKRS
jgi:hypothetical protein